MLLTAYCMILFDVIAVKFYGNLSEMGDRIQRIQQNRDAGFWNIQLEPFHTIPSQIRGIFREFENGSPMRIIGSYDLRIFLLNIMAFLPVGFLSPLSFSKRKSWVRDMVFFIFFTVGIELFQLVTLLGYFDTNDILLNFTGCMMGYIIYLVFRTVISQWKRRERPKRPQRVGWRLLGDRKNS